MGLNGLGIAFALGGDGERRELDHAVFVRCGGSRTAHEIDFTHRGLSGGDGKRVLDRRVAREEHRDRGGAGRNIGELKRSVALRIRGPVRAIEPNLGIADVVFRNWVKHPTLHRAGAGLGVNKGGREQPSESETNQGRQAPSQSSER